MMDLTGFDFDEDGVLLLIEDWYAMERVIDKYGIKTILEFGSGFSTRLFCAKGLRVISYEQSTEWAERVQEMCPKADIRIYEGGVLKGPTAHMVFIDSPWCDGTDPRFVDRRNAYASAIGMQAKVIACHDADREGDAALEMEFLAPRGKLVDQSRICHIYEMGVK